MLADLARRPQVRKLASWLVLGLSAAVLWAGLQAVVAWDAKAAAERFRPPAETSPSVAADRQLAGMTLGAQAKVLEKGGQAQVLNDQIKFATGPLDAAARFNAIPATGSDHANALTCLTQAIYYEAASEPLAGRRAVAQVVLNRVRHPAYPNSVCGVVFEGHRLRVCQFSFTCDGSLLRSPSRRLWQEAEKIARSALAGSVERSVGTATHYHADYVLPRWAYTLDKVESIGRHLFYRFPGRAGRATAFRARWSGNEFVPGIDRTRLAAVLDAQPDDELIALDADLTPGLTVVPARSDRHAPADIGGRLDTTKQWRLAIPDPAQASGGYRATHAAQAGGIEAFALPTDVP